MAFSTLLENKLNERKLTSTDVLEEYHDFYKVISFELYQDPGSHKTLRKNICDFQKEERNIPYFELFLPRPNAGNQHESSPREEFLKDVEKSRLADKPPTARELYAASEFLGRSIEVLTSDMTQPSVGQGVYWREYAPVLGRTTSEEKQSIKLLLLLDSEGAVFCGFRRIDRRDQMTGTKAACQSKFQNDFRLQGEQPSQPIYKMNYCRSQIVVSDSHSFYECISEQVYRRKDYWQRVKKLVIALEEQEDYVHVFASFVTEEESNKKKQKALKEHLSQLQELDSVVSSGEIFAAASVFQITVYLKRNMEFDGNEDWEMYSPVTNHLRNVKPTESFITLERRGELYLRWNNDENAAPSIPGNISVFQEHITRIATSLLISGEMGSPDISVFQEHITRIATSLHVRGEMGFPDNRIEEKLQKVRVAMDNWIEISQETEDLCYEIISELEDRRVGVNAATIAGGSVGLIGAGLAIAGVIAAPFTAGVSLGLTIAGGVVGGAGGITMAGSKITEVALGSRATDKLKEKQTILEEKSHVLKKTIQDFKESAEQMEKDIKGLVRDNSLQAVDTAILSSVSTLVRALHHLYVIPTTVLRISFQSVAIISAILIPLAVVVDVASIAHAGWNLKQKSRTNVSEDLRRIAALLQSCRIQLDTWAYGNRIGSS